MPTGTGVAKAFFALISEKVYCTEKAHGFGDAYKWAKSLESGLALASRNKKPVMVIIHKSFCFACQKLKARLATDREVQELSRNFIMVSLEDNEEPLGRMYAPDGLYVPRILFISPSGHVDHTIYNVDGDSDSKYFYGQTGQLAKAMRTALAKYDIVQY